MASSMLSQMNRFFSHDPFGFAKASSHAKRICELSSWCLQLLAPHVATPTIRRRSQTMRKLTVTTNLGVARHHDCAFNCLLAAIQCITCAYICKYICILNVYMRLSDKMTSIDFILKSNTVLAVTESSASPGDTAPSIGRLSRLLVGETHLRLPYTGPTLHMKLHIRFPEWSICNL